MIFISSSCIKANKIGDAVYMLANQGYKNIELSGGTILYENWFDDLKRLKKEFNLNYLCHNYFPPPEKPFVFNLGSLDENISFLSLKHAKRAINWASELDTNKIGFHAGFLFDIPLREIGNKISNKKLFEKNLVVEKFISNYDEVLNYALSKGLDLYIENNVLSFDNFERFGSNPFLFVESSEISFFNEKLNSFNYIFDYAHSYVSSKSLGLNVIDEFDCFIKNTNYVHLSDNNGFSDTNNEILKNSMIYNHLVSNPPIDKTVTLEIYTGFDNLKSSYNWLNSLIS